MAPVNAPRRWPKSWLSTSSRATAEQLKGTNGPRFCGLCSWMIRAKTSLPVPVSPVRRMGRLVSARRSAILSELDHAGRPEDRVFAAGQHGPGPEVLFVVLRVAVGVAVDRDADQFGDASDEENLVERLDLADTNRDRPIRSAQSDGEGAVGFGLGRGGQLGLMGPAGLVGHLDGGAMADAPQDLRGAVGQEVDGTAGAEDGGGIAEEQGRIGQVEVMAVDADGFALAPHDGLAITFNPAFMVPMSDGPARRQRAIEMRRPAREAAAEAQTEPLGGLEDDEGIDGASGTDSDGTCGYCVCLTR